MSRVVVLGAGVSGHTAAAFARKWLDRRDEVVVVSPLPHYNWIPSNIWVGVGLMKPSQVTFPLAPVYERNRHRLPAGAGGGDPPRGPRATTRHPSSWWSRPVPATRGSARRSATTSSSTPPGRSSTSARPRASGPAGHSLSVCTESHAAETARALDEAVARMKRGERQRFLVGTGHGACTCQGAAFEYIVNLEFELRARRVRDRADIAWITNEYELGDFGMGGMHIRTRRLRDAEQDLHRVALRRARHPLDHARPRDARSKRAAPTTRRSTASTREAGVRLRHAPAALLGRRAEGARPTRRRHHAEGLPAERLHEGRRRLHGEAVRAVVGAGLAAHLPVARLPERLRGGHRLRAAARDLAAAARPRAARPSPPRPAHRHALGDDRQGGRRAASST